MGRSNRLRVADVRDALRLVGDCRDVGRDRRAWLGRAADGLRRLVRAPVVIATAQAGGWAGPAGVVEFLDAGWDECGADRGMFLASMAESGRSPDFHAFRRLAAERPTLTCRRPRLIGDVDWRRDWFADTFRRAGGTDEYLASEAVGARGGLTTTMQVCRPVGEPGFSGQEATLGHFFHTEVARLVGHSLTAATDPQAGLSPRLRQTLDRLLEGDSEKETAARLELSQPTVHQYVTELYRRFGVSSRAELLAHFLRLAGGGPTCHEPAGG